MNLAQEYLDGSSSIELARRYNLTKRCVLYRLRKAGVTRRSNSEALRRHHVNEYVFDSFTEESAYWLGFLLADGNIGDTGRNRKARQLRCTLQERDVGHLEMLRIWLGSTHPMKYLPDKKAWLLRITSKRLVRPLEEAGWYGFKKHGDVSILNAVPYNLQSHLIRGMIDGDGYIGYDGKWRFGFVDLHYDVVHWVQSWFMDNAGVKRTKINHPSMAYTFYYTGNIQVPRLMNLLYANCTVALDRKLKLASRAIQLHLSRPSLRNQG